MLSARLAKLTAYSTLIEPAQFFGLSSWGALDMHASSSTKFESSPEIDFRITGTGNSLIRGEGSALIRPRRLIVEGDDNLIYFGPYTRVGNLDVVIRGSGSVIYVGAFTTCGGLGVRINASNSIRIVGDYGMLASRVVLGGPVHATFDGDDLPASRGEVEIGQHVWIGRDCVVLPGTTVGGDSIIGQCSHVQGHFPANSVVSGQPARVLARDVNWGRTQLGSLDEERNSKHFQTLRARPEKKLRSRIEAATG